MRYIRTKDGKLFDLKKIRDEIKNDEIANVFYRDYRFEKPRPYHSCGDLVRGLIIDYTYKGVANVDFIKKDKTYNSYVWLECDPEGYRESDDITELCDCYVVYEKSGGFVGEHRTYNDLELAKYGANEHVSIVYGAIWTDKGLSYVAELGKNGKWKVL